LYIDIGEVIDDIDINSDGGGVKGDVGEIGDVMV